MENQNPRGTPLLEHSLTTVLGMTLPVTLGYSPHAMGTLPRSTQHLGPTQLGPRRT